MKLIAFTTKLLAFEINNRKHKIFYFLELRFENRRISYRRRKPIELIELTFPLELSRLHRWNRPWRCGWDSFKGWSRAFSEHKSFRILGNRALELQRRLESAPWIPAFPLARLFSTTIFPSRTYHFLLFHIENSFENWQIIKEKFWLTHRSNWWQFDLEGEREKKKKRRRKEDG